MTDMVVWDEPLTNDQVASAPTGGVPDRSKHPVGSPAWWRDRLLLQLEDQRRATKLTRDYYEGRHRMPFATQQWQGMFGQVFRDAQNNFLQIVVDSVDERLQVEGIRVPTEATDEAALAALLTGDKDAWAIWQRNGMDAESQLVHTDALVDGLSFVTVGPGLDGPLIAGETSQQLVVELEAGTRRRIAALKEWRAPDGRVYVTLYRPDRVYKWSSERPVSEHSHASDITAWVNRRGPTDPAWPIVNPLGMVPVVPFYNRPRGGGLGGRSEIDQLIPLQDAINKTFMDLLIASEYLGVPQRYGTGVERPVDPDTNQPISHERWLKMTMDRFITVPDPEARLGSLPAGDLRNYTGALSMQVQHLASRSSTPPHYFLAAQGNFPSGESLKAAETGLVSKVRRRMKHFGESWEEVFRLVLLLAGQPEKARAAEAAETIWGDPESRSESEHIDALSKLAALGVPDEVLWEKSGMFTPVEIERMKKMIAAGAPTQVARAAAETAQAVRRATAVAGATEGARRDAGGQEGGRDAPEGRAGGQVGRP